MRYRSIFVGLALFATSVSHAQHPVVQAILDSVRIDSMMLYLNELTGEVPIDLGNGPETIVSRHKNNPGNALAQAWLEHKLVQFGYVTQVQSWSTTGRNILVTKPGTVPGATALVFGAHYDAMPGGNLAAPAADDNGSGTAALLEAARVLRNIEFEHPIIFTFWDEEEQGLVGSEYQAAGLASNDVLLRGVINMDAIAYDGNGDKRMRVHVRPVGNSIEIGDTLVAVRSHYDLDLDLVVTNPGATYSDHASFWNEGYGAVLVIEDFGPDGNPNYHLPSDLVEYLDVPYYEKIAKLAIAGAATLAVPVDVAQGMPSAEPGPLFRISAYPNPTEGDLTFWVESSVSASTRIVLHDALGHVVAVMHEGLLPVGKQAFDLSLSSLAPGTYAIVAEQAGKAPAVVRVVRTP
jgi:hypothetical protein